MDITADSIAKDLYDAGWRVSWMQRHFDTWQVPDARFRCEVCLQHVRSLVRAYGHGATPIEAVRDAEDTTRKYLRGDFKWKTPATPIRLEFVDIAGTPA